MPLFNRGLLDDTSFHEACEKVIHEPTPLFHQITTKEPPETAATATPSAPVPVMVDTDSPVQRVSTPYADGSPEIEVHVDSYHEMFNKYYFHATEVPFIHGYYTTIVLQRIKSASSVSSVASTMSSCSHSSAGSQKGGKTSGSRSRTLTPEQADVAEPQASSPAEEADEEMETTPARLTGTPAPADYEFQAKQESKKYVLAFLTVMDVTALMFYI